jgi:hypothetical protein
MVESLAEPENATSAILVVALVVGVSESILVLSAFNEEQNLEGVFASTGCDGVSHLLLN